MLILTRKRGERIIINDNTIVTVESYNRNNVTISIQETSNIIPATLVQNPKESLFKRAQNRFNNK